MLPPPPAEALELELELDALLEVDELASPPCPPAPPAWPDPVLSLGLPERASLVSRLQPDDAMLKSATAASLTGSAPREPRPGPRDGSRISLRNSADLGAGDQ